MAQEGWKLEQEEAPCTPPATSPKLCSNNCGFFGSVSTMNLCSSCYKTLVLLKPKSPAQISSALLDQEIHNNEQISLLPASSTSSPSATAMVVSSPSSSSAMLTLDITSCKESEKAQPVRCLSCNKKVGLRGFKCRCGDIFCAGHRYSDKHACSFDYKAAGRASIAKANPVVQADKLNRI